MTAVYPNQIRNYVARTDLVDTVIADNVNSLQEEVKAIETVLGSAATTQNPLVSTYGGTWTTATSTWNTVADRLANLEAGVLSRVSASAVTAAGDLLIGSGVGTISRIALGTNGQVLTSNGTTAVWSSLPGLVSQTNGTVTTASVSSGVVRNIYTSTSSPSSSDGSVGDIWVVYS